jgi:hypothetical protein
MANKSKPERLLSLRDVSKELKISWPRAVALAADGTFSPDFLTTQAKLFRPSRLKELERQLRLIA